MAKAFMKSEVQNASSNWDEQDLIKRLCHALDLAKLTVGQLANEGYTDPENPGKNIRPEKIISETAILLLSASSVAGHSQIGERVKTLTEALTPHARSERMMLGLCLEPTVAWDYALPHVVLARLGHPDQGFDELLRTALDAESRAGRERVPHRVLEQEWIAAMWQRSQRSDTPSLTARLSILNQAMDVLNATREDVYAFTHALMYVTDFNLSPAALVRSRDILLNEAEALLARCLDEQDYDLAGEVLLSWPLTGKSWSATGAFAFRILARVEDRAGFLPTPSTRVEKIRSLKGISRTQYLLATAYHTAYVMGLLCAASLRDGHAPPSRIPTGCSKRGAASHILGLLDLNGQAPHWYEEFQLLSEPEADALAGFLVNVLLRRRLTRRDFDGVRAVLQTVCDVELDGGAAVRQAAEMLQRLATYAQVKANLQLSTDSVPDIALPY
ncbi:MAG TPA: hypothetical protein VGS27_08355 [Candidatus Sulfotelmatobacter sp.]|nr:hypothetical protein [Candidatus Sulfotelmatobacter sp.]